MIEEKPKREALLNENGADGKRLTTESLVTNEHLKDMGY